MAKQQKVITTTSTTIVELTIFDKYRKFINSARSGSVVGLQYEDAMVMLRYIEKKINNQYPINMSCGTCLLELVKTFASFEK